MADEQNPREPQVNADPGEGNFDERTQEVTPWKDQNEAQAGSKRPDPIVVPEGERRSEPAPEKSKSQERREAVQKAAPRKTTSKSGKKSVK